MPRQFLKRIIPSPHTLRERWFLRPFGTRITDPQLWTLHRRGVTAASRPIAGFTERPPLLDSTRHWPRFRIML